MEREICKAQYDFLLDVEFKIYEDGIGDPSESRLWKKVICIDDVIVRLGRVEITNQISSRECNYIEEKALDIGVDKLIGREMTLSKEIEASLEVAIKRNEKNAFRVYVGSLDVTDEIDEEDLLNLLDGIEE